MQQLVLRLIAYVFIAAVHGFTVAAVAVAMGDQGPRYDGRLRVSLLAHLDIIGTASGALFSVGWITPIAIDPFELRLGRIGLAVVVWGGAAPTFLSAVAVPVGRAVLFPVVSHTGFATGFSMFQGFG